MTSSNTALLKHRSSITRVLAPGTVMLASALASAPALAQQPPSSYGPHMWGGVWWMVLGPFTMLLFIAAIVALVVLLVRWLSGTRRNGPAVPGAKTPLDILQERFACGEIDKEEFEERRRVLGA